MYSTINKSELPRAGHTDGECSELVEVTSVGEPVRQNDVSWFPPEYNYYNGKNKRLNDTSDQTTVVNQNCLSTASSHWG